MPKYDTRYCEGYWEDDSESIFTVKIALGEWDEVEDDEDQEIFWYTDKHPLNVGDIIADGFVIISIEEK